MPLFFHGYLDLRDWIRGSQIYLMDITLVDLVK